MPTAPRWGVPSARRTSEPSAARRASRRCGNSPARGVEAVGTPESWDMAIGMARAGGRVGAVGVPHTAPQLALFPPFRQHLTIGMGVAPVRRYLPDLVGRVLDGRFDPGRVFALTLPLEQVADGYAAMSDRRSIKTMLAA